jgi:hypothetical protein
MAAQQPTRATATRSTLCSKPAALAYPGQAMAENPCASLAKEKGHKRNQINIINKLFTLFFNNKQLYKLAAVSCSDQYIIQVYFM